MDRVSEGKINGKQRVQVTKGKITVNVWWNSRGNHFLFELGRFHAIGSQL